MKHLDQHEGAWAGTNAFRLMPDDPPHVAPLSAKVTRSAKAGLTQIVYSWTHPDDGQQEGLLVLGQGKDPNGVAAFWGDSWHQSPEPRTLDGIAEGGVLTLGYEYSGQWRWEIVVDARGPDALALTMNNVIPESAATEGMPAGPYPAMKALLGPQGSAPHEIRSA